MLNQTAIGPNPADSALSLIALFATLVVAVAALVQALAARQTVGEMKTTRQLEYTPQLRVFLNIHAVVVVFLKIVNIGKAAATDIELKILFMKDGQTIEQREYIEDAILPHESTELILPEPHFEKMLGKFTQVNIAGTCKDSVGGSYAVNQSIDVKQFVDYIKQAKIYAGTSS